MEIPKSTIATSVRLPEDLVNWIDSHAEENVRSRNQEIEYLLRKGMAMIRDREAAEKASDEGADLKPKRSAG
jgi:hypothetical protein